MTPAERALVSELFDRLASLENSERDREAERVIRDGLRQAPNAPYSLVQTVLVQDEALKRADARIQELENELGIGSPPPREPGFLDSMRDALLGRREEPRAGSVPSVHPSDAPANSVWGRSSGFPTPAQPMPAGAMPSEPMRPGGSFLGTAAAAAAGMVGGSLLLNSMRGMMGHSHAGAGFGQAAAGTGNAASPWANTEQGELSRQAGIDDIGRRDGGHDDSGSRQGMFDTAANDADLDELDAGDFDDDGFDYGGSDSDSA
jgi:hypothetical protein